jgi:hypothetical protein
MDRQTRWQQAERQRRSMPPRELDVQGDCRRSMHWGEGWDGQASALAAASPRKKKIPTPISQLPRQTRHVVEQAPAQAGPSLVIPTIRCRCRFVPAKAGLLTLCGVTTFLDKSSTALGRSCGVVAGTGHLRWRWCCRLRRSSPSSTSAASGSVRTQGRTRACAVMVASARSGRPTTGCGCRKPAASRSACTSQSGTTETQRESSQTQRVHGAAANHLVGVGVCVWCSEGAVHVQFMLGSIHARTICTVLEERVCLTWEIRSPVF